VKAKATPEFWECYNALPAEIQALARKSFRFWHGNPRHPSLRFRPHSHGKWSARIGEHYRAIAYSDGEIFIWTWIGSHEQYNKF
jgi:mRNA-degrading endonuclease RelE of RelBE toxin-antitoxin system